ncbi:4905_t:CDS:2, partial [Gigaspora margarita]
MVHRYKKIQEEVNKSLEDNILDLEKAVSRGEYNKETTPLFELKDNNPAEDDFAIRQNTLEELKIENQQLLAKLEDATQKLSGVDINKEIAKKEKMVSLVEEAIDNKFKLLTRIFGYNIEFLENDYVKITLIYSDPEDHKSSFEPDQDEANGSVPYLLGNVTVKLFEEKNASKSNEDESFLD